MSGKIFIDDIVYHPTFNCNLSCRGCVNYSNHLETRKIPDESNWARDLDILFSRFEVNHIEIAGGETLMFPHLQDLIKRLAPVKKYTITTNGLLLHKNMWIRDLLDSDTRFDLQISVHGHPLQESVYIKTLCENIELLLGIPSSKFKKLLRLHYLSEHVSGEAFNVYNSRVHIKIHHKGNWAYPLLDKDELPMLFNNNKEDAYKRCICPSMHIKNGKIYKCPMTAMLPSVLDSKGIHDSKWQFIRDYVPYNLLEEHNSDSWATLRIAEDICTRCPYSAQEWDRTKTDLHSKIVFGESVLK